MRRLLERWLKETRWRWQGAASEQGVTTATAAPCIALHPILRNSPADMTARRTLLAVLLALSGIAAFTPAMAQSPHPYSLMTLEDGTRYLGSEVFIRRGGPNLDQHLLDQALEISDAGVRHAPTGLVLPRVAGPCSLEWISGVAVQTPAGRFLSFERGGRAYYACDAGAPSFIVLSFEADMPGFAVIQPDPARALLAGGMALRPAPDALICTEARTGPVRRVACHAETEWSGQTVSEQGLFFENGDSFLKLNAACLEAQCEAVTTELARLAETIGGPRLSADVLDR